MASTVTAATDKVLYSPTSPVGSEGSLPSPAGEVDDSTNPVYDDFAKQTVDSTEPAYRPAPTAKSADQPKPLLLIGPRFEKELALNANRWVRIGRSTKAQLLLQNSGVSRSHCSLKWDRHRRVVELKDTSISGTQVNGEITKGMRRALVHGDRIRIEGKGMRYDFILDLRPVGLGLTDPREEQAQHWKGLRGPALRQRRDTLRAQLAHLESSIAKCDREAFTKEREFYEIVTRRSMRAKEDAEREENFRKYTLGAQALETKLKESREEWLEKLQGVYDDNARETAPIIDNVAHLQTKVEKLQLKKDELERSIHPEKYAIADVSRVGSYSLDLPTPQKTPSQSASRNGDAEGEDDPLSMLSGAREPTTPGAGKRPASPASFGDEPEAKQQKVEQKIEQKVEQPMD